MDNQGRRNNQQALQTPGELIWVGGPSRLPRANSDSSPSPILDPCGVDNIGITAHIILRSDGEEVQRL